MTSRCRHTGSSITNHFIELQPSPSECPPFVCFQLAIEHNEISHNKALTANASHDLDNH